MAAALIRRVISPALLSSSLRPVRTVAAQPAVSTRFFHYNLIHQPDSDSDAMVRPFPKVITRDTDDGVYVFMVMRGVNKDVKVRVEQNTLVLKGG